MPKKIEIEILIDEIVKQATFFKIKNREFYPFGILFLKNNNLKNINILDEEISKENILISFRNIIELNVIREKKYSSGAFCYDCLYNNADAFGIEVFGENSTGWIKLFLPYNIGDNDEIDYGEFSYELSNS